MSDKGGEKARLVRKEVASPAAQAIQNKGAPCAPCCHKVAMAVPPAYSDLGKAAKDIFGKGYGESSNHPLHHHTQGEREETPLAKGLKLALDTSFVPNTGKKSAKLKTGYKRDFINLGCDLDFDMASPTVHAAAVLGYEGWLAGYQMAFDTAKSKLAQNNFALGYKAGDFQLHTNVNDGTEFGGSIYQKVNCHLETAINLAWTAGSNNTRFGIGAKYQLDKDASLSAKVNNASLIGVGYTQALRPGVKLTLSALIDAKNFNAGGHKVGMGFELEA
uniref:Non-selective voltage-gated ion channel VDAC3 n=1 Tax=Salmo trutta TaxID=8032 RepID=A0A674EIJ0_SALTR